MLSMRARLIRYLLQHRHWLKGQFKNNIVDWNTYDAVLRFREDVENGAGKFGKLPEGVEVSPFFIGAMPAEWVIPKGSADDQTILYFHGGGYISGTCRAHRSTVAKFVQGSGLRALLFEYRLAPEHRFPAAVEDSVAAYKWLLHHGVTPSRIVFLGDSAGGGLALATLLALKDQNIPLPAGASAYSPVTDYTCSGESYRTNAKTCLAPEGTGPAFAKHYAGDADLHNPYISPLYGDLQGLPPLLIYVGSTETLLDDSLRFADKARSAGVDIELHVGEGLFHCYPAMAPFFPEARGAMKDICEFIVKSVKSQEC